MRTKPLLSVSLTFMFLLLTETSWLNAAADYKYYNQTTYHLGPGVKYTKTEYTTEEGPQTIHVVHITRDNPHLFIQSGLTGGKVLGTQNIYEYAKGLNIENQTVLAAINGDFFYTTGRNKGSPYGLHIQEGEIFLSPNRFPSFAVQKGGGFYIGRADLSVELEVYNGSGESVIKNPIEGINQLTSSGIALYTPIFSSKTPKSLVPTTEVIINPATWTENQVIGSVSHIRQGMGENDIPPYGLVLSGKTDLPIFDNIYIGDVIKITLDLTPPFDQSVYAISGPHFLVHNGVSMVTDSSDLLVTNPHPRTALGYNDDELILVVVDGRDSTSAAGMNLKDLAEFMIDLGIKEAINLDGGGSSTLVIKHPLTGKLQIANTPSDGQARGVGNGLLILVNSFFTGDIQRLEIIPHSPAVLIDNRLPLSVYGIDEYSQSIPITDPNSIEWSVLVGSGLIENSQFISDQKGLATIEARIGQAYGSINVSVVDRLDSLKTIPDMIMLNTGQTISTKIVAIYNQERIQVDASALIWEYPEDIVQIHPDGSIEAILPGDGVLQASYGETKTSIQISINQPPVILWDFRTIGNWHSTSSKARSQVYLYPADDGTYVRLDYDLQTGETGTSAAYLVADPKIVIPKAPKKIGIWVYGDGKGHWLRCQYYDASGMVKTADFSSAEGITFSGWQYLEADLDPDLAAPYQLWRIYLVQTDESKKSAGSVMFRDLTAIY